MILQKRYIVKGILNKENFLIPERKGRYFEWRNSDPDSSDDLAFTRCKVFSTGGGVGVEEDHSLMEHRVPHDGLPKSNLGLLSQPTSLNFSLAHPLLFLSFPKFLYTCLLASLKISLLHFSSNILIRVKNFLRVFVFGSICLSGFLGPQAYALQSGGVEFGDFSTGTVVGQPFRTLEVDLEITALCVGGQKAWYPPVSVLNLQTQGTGGRSGRPVLIKVRNALPLRVGFYLSADSAFAGPTSMTIRLILNPGETKYVGIPLSDLTYVTVSNVNHYGSHTDHRMLGGQILILR